MKQPLFFILLVFVFVSGCSDKQVETSRKVTVNRKEYTIRITSSKSWDAGVAGGGHAPIFIPYLNRNISNAVEITNPKGWTFYPDGLEEYSDLIPERELTKIADAISLRGSPDGATLLYARKQDSTTRCQVIHVMESGQMFWTGYYDTLFTKATNADKDPDWKCIPSIENVAKRFLSDTASLNSGYASMITTALFSLPHPNSIDRFALDAFTATDNATYYINELCRDSALMNSSEEWRTDVAARFRTLSRMLENEVNNGDTSSTPSILYAQLVKLGDEFEAINTLPVLDSSLARMAFVNVYFFYRFEERCNSGYEPAIGDPEKKYFITLFRKYMGTHPLAGPERARNIFDMGNDLENEEMMTFGQEQFIRTWPEMAEDTIEPNLLEAYFDQFSEAAQKRILDKAKLSLKGKYNVVAEQMLQRHASCELLDELRTAYPGRFTEIRSDCIKSSSDTLSNGI